MFINKLRILNFEIILDKDFKLRNKVNIFYGENGVGKQVFSKQLIIFRPGKSISGKVITKILFNYKSNDFTFGYLGYNKDDLENSISVRKDKKVNGKQKRTIPTFLSNPLLLSPYL